MPTDRFRTGYVATAEDGALIQFSRKGKQRFTLHYMPAAQTIKIATIIDKMFSAPAAPLLIFEGDEKNDVAVIYPLNTRPTSREFLKPKYKTLTTLTLYKFGVPNANDVEEAQEFLRSLPAGFVKDPFFGLGLNYDLRFLTDALERMAGITDVQIVRGRSSGLPKIKGKSYVLSAKMLDDARKAINRIHGKALQIATQEKRTFAHNTLLTAVDSVAFPPKQQSYYKDAVLKALGDSLARNIPLSRADQKAVITAAKTTVRLAGRSDPAELLGLAREIEVVTLEALLERLKARLEKNLDEAAWQAFFVDNPFILRLAFGLPIMLFREQVTVGGRRFSGKGEKISDFAVKAASGNLSLIEIKTPKTALLEARAYRGDLYAPSRELAGAINQILDQRYHLQKSIANLKEASRVYDVESYAIQGLVIAGRMPSDSTRLKSLELFRNGLKSVTVITFDELVEKLKHLLEVLRAPEPENMSSPASVSATTLETGRDFEDTIRN